jgi:2-aminoadipate transaminase
MPAKVERLASALAQGGAPLFFPDPPAPVTFNFDQGIAAEETFPLEELKELSARIIDRDEGRALEYISFDYDKANDDIIYISSYIELVLGHTGMREQLAQWMGAKQGIDWLEADNYILTSGSVQAIAMAINAFLDPGEGALVEAASFPYAMRFMQMRGADMRAVEIDEQGMVPESLESRLKEFVADGVRPKFLYVIPTFQLPTGVVMPLQRRLRILELAEKYDLVVLEDNVYGDLRYEGEHLPTLLSLDRNGRVIQSSSFSKTVAPALRLGWMAGSKELIGALAAVRQDLGTSQWTARLMAEFLAEGKLEPHIERANEVYRRKRDIAVETVREHCGEHVTFSVPEGAFYLWLALDESVDWESAQRDASMAGVFCRPGEKFMGAEAGRGFLRIAFSHAPDHELRRGLAALGKAIRDNVKQ